MKKPNGALIAVIVCMILVMISSIGLGYALHDRIAFGSGPTFKTLQEMAGKVEKYFYFYDEKQKDEGQLIDGALRGMIKSLDDPYAAYYTQEEYDALLAEDEGNYTGLGISVGAPDESGSTILEIYAGSPADQAGVRKGDVITAVNGKQTGGLSMDEFLLLFSEDDAVPDVLTLLRGAEMLTITVLRGAVHIERVTHEILENGIGYVRISEFSGSVVSDFWNAATALRSAGVTDLIIDLRDNPGGGLTEVLGVAYKLIPKGQLIATIKSKTEAAKIYRSEGDERVEMRMAVLVNGGSASASELLTGALQSHGIATVVGTQTYGKGIVQSYFRLSGNGGWMKLTTDAYYTPSDVCIQDVGITPDIVVDLPEELKTQALETIDRAKDTQLQAAIATFSEEADAQRNAA